MKDAIKAHLFETMHDYKSYEPVKFGKLDSVYTTYEESKEFLELANTTDSLIDLCKSLNDNLEDLRSENSLDRLRYYEWYAGSKYDIAEHKKMDSIRNLSSHLIDTLQTLTALMKQNQAAFQPEFNGYSTTHTYRGKNMNGATIINTTIFYLNKNLDSVINTKELNDK